MVDFSVSEEMQMVLKTLKRFIQTELAPHEAEVEEKQFVRPELALELRTKAKALGLFALGMPADPLGSYGVWGLLLGALNIGASLLIVTLRISR